MSVEEAEVVAIEKLNRLLISHKRGFTFKINHLYSRQDKVEICGSCIGRRFWRDILQVVNCFADYWCDSSLYIDFKGLASNDVFELLVKLDLKVS